MTRPWIYLCFFLSGFSGLVNEVVWSRLFVYKLGSSHLSIAVVVSVFMGGLALGSAVGGPLADRARSPLRLYGWLVLAAGSLAGAVAPLLWLLDPAIGWAYRLHDGDPGHPLFTAVKAAVCAGTIFIPTTLMGATLPALVQHLTRSVAEVGARVGALYAVNTFGAVAGTAAAGFFLVGKVGLGWSAAIGAGIDILVGSAVLFWTRGEAPAPAATPADWAAAPAAEAPPAGLAAPRIPWPVRVAVIAFGVSGFVNMCLQLGWTRALIISIGNSTYAFSTIVGIFIFGLAAGGWIAGLFADRLKNPAAAFGWVLVAIATASGATLPWLGLSTSRFAWDLGALVRRGDFGFADFLLAGAGRVALAILPATVLMGMTFPLVGRLRALAAPGVGRAIGAAYAANTVGAILGTALTGFVLVPLLGRIWALLYLAVGLGLLAGTAVLIAAPGERRGRRLALLGAWIALLAGLAYPTRPAEVLPSRGEPRLYWHPVVLSQGAYRSYSMAQHFPSPDAYGRALIQVLEPLYYRDGEVASVAVLRVRSTGKLSLNITGKTDASAGLDASELPSGDMPTQLLLGHLPLLLHPSPRRSLVLGLGGGVTLGAMVLHPEVESIDLLEISPEVEEAARRHFAEANHGALGSPKVRAVIGDGRNHLAHTARTYDVISSEPSNFWIAGLGNLFTEEFYRIVRKRLNLNPGGIVCQWIYCYSLQTEDFRIALRTFLSIFPHVTVWTPNQVDTLLLGSLDPSAFDRSRIEAALANPAVREELATVGVTVPEDLFRFFLADGKALMDWIGDGATNRDFFPVLEFSSPLGYFNTYPGIQFELTSIAPEKPAAALFRGFSPEQMGLVEARIRLGRNLIRLYHRLDRWELEKALEEYRSLAKDGDRWSIGAAAADMAQRLEGRVPRKAEFLQRVREIRDTPELCMADGFRPLPGASPAAQIEVARSAARSSPAGSWAPHLALAGMEARAGLTEDALKSLETARSRGAPAHKHDLLRGVLAGMQGDLEMAEKLLRAALEGTPPAEAEGKGEAAYNLGFCLEQRSRFAEAVEAYRQAIDLGNDPVRARIAAARCLRRQGKHAEAVEEAKKAIQAAHEEKRDSGEARAEIARALTAAGNLAEALQWMESAAKISPQLYTQELEALRSRARE